MIGEPCARTVGGWPWRRTRGVDGVLQARDDALMEQTANMIATRNGDAVERSSIPGDGVVPPADGIISNQILDSVSMLIFNHQRKQTVSRCFIRNRDVPGRGRWWRVNLASPESRRKRQN